MVTNRRYRDLVLEHLPELRPEQVLCEPIGRNTAPCIAYAAYTLLKSDPEAEMIVTPADHFILDEEAFRGVIGECLDFAREHDALMTVGIRPTRPETGYGYIQVSDDRPISKVKCFTEKPNPRTGPDLPPVRRVLLELGHLRVDRARHRGGVPPLPARARHALRRRDARLGTDAERNIVEMAFAECRAISIDYGIMEKADNVYVRCGDFGWSDVGTWGSVYQHARKATATPTPRPPRGATSTTRGAASSRCPRARWPSSAA